MKKVNKSTVAGHTLLLAMCIVWIAYGWYILLEGGFYSRPRGAEETTYVDGPGSTLMAFLFFSLAAICTAITLKRFGASRAVSTATTFAILGSPVVYLAARYL